jgi:hypothetical protein
LPPAGQCPDDATSRWRLNSFRSRLQNWMFRHSAPALWLYDVRVLLCLWMEQAPSPERRHMFDDLQGSLQTPSNAMSLYCRPDPCCCHALILAGVQSTLCHESATTRGGGLIWFAWMQHGYFRCAFGRVLLNSGIPPIESGIDDAGDEGARVLVNALSAVECCLITSLAVVGGVRRLPPGGTGKTTLL